MGLANKLDLSICVVTWNARDLTIACLKSLIEYTHCIEYEIFLVDNGSTDGTIEKVRNVFPQVNIIANTSNEGFSYANNQALRLVKGRYAILLNNDMLFNSDALSRMVAFMDHYCNVGVMECRLRLPNGTVQHTAHEDLKWQDYLFASFFLNQLFPRSRIFGRINCTYLDYEADNLVFDVGWVAGAALMVRTESIAHVGLLDERIFTTCEDWEWCRRYYSSGYRVVYYTGAEIIHYHGMSTVRYVGTDRNKVRKYSILRMSAGTYYVFSKLHAGRSFKIFLFALAFRLYCFSRVIALGLRNLLYPRKADYGTFRGYLVSAIMSYKFLGKQYLRLVSDG